MRKPDTRIPWTYKNPLNEGSPHLVSMSEGNAIIETGERLEFDIREH